MMDKIDTLEKERLKLKAFSAEVIENNIESILGSMPLSMLVNKRDGSDSKDPAEEVQHELLFIYLNAIILYICENSSIPSLWN